MFAFFIVTCGLFAAPSVSTRIESNENGTKASSGKSTLADLGATRKCVDTDNGAWDFRGWTCEQYDQERCDSYTSYAYNFDPHKMCCICGGGLQEPGSGDCPKTCGEGWSCEDWVRGNGLTCSQLEADHGCDCSGCAHCSPQDFPQELPQEQEEELQPPDTHAADLPEETVDIVTGGDAANHGQPAIAVPSYVGLMHEYYAQTYTFAKRSAFVLENMFEPPSACVDQSPDVCPDLVKLGCDSEETRAKCKASCALCNYMQPVGVDVMFLVRTSEGSLKGAMNVVIGGQASGGLTVYRMMKSEAMGLHTSWRVMTLDEQIMFTLQKGKDADCKYMLLDCKAAWNIYKGRTRDQQGFLYGIQHKSSFQFWKSRADFIKGDVPYFASFRKTVPTSENGESLFQVSVMPGADSGLFLLASWAVYKAGDLPNSQGSVSD